MTELTVSQALSKAKQQLARLDAEVLLAHVLGKPRVWLRTWPEHALEAEQLQSFHDLLTRRAAGEPVAYLVGYREFWSLTLTVSADTLIPRPETERLVELALALIPPDAAWHIADLGTGSGAIALAIASERPRCEVVATDRSSAALAVARANATQLGIENVSFREGSWCAALPDQRFEMIVSNPPYIAEGDSHLAQGDVRFEPGTALTSGATGLADLRQIISEAKQHLAPGGWLLLEHGFNQGAEVVALLAEFGYSEIVDYNDYAGHARVACASLAGGK